MTKREQITMDMLSQKLDTFMADDAKWKADVTAKLTPLVEERVDRMIIQKYGLKTFKILATILGFFVSIGMLFKYVISPLMHWK